MRKPEGGGGGGGGGGSSSSNSWGRGLCEKSCRLLQKWTSTTPKKKKKKTSCYVKGRNVISNTKFGEDEDDLIIKLHALLGNRWSLIAGRLPGRTDNEVKNYWNSHLRRKLQTKGIDPDSRRRSLSQTAVIPSINFMTSVKATPKSYNDQVSDAVSSFSADYGTISPITMPTTDLNLELTLSTMNPSPSSLISSCRFTETDQQHVDQFKVVGNMDHHHDQFMKNETLVLFR